MFLKKFLSILTYFVWKKVWLLKFSIFSKKISEKFCVDRKNFSGLTGKIFPDSPEKFFRQTYLHLIHILKNDKCKCSVQYVWGKICGIYNKPCMYSTTIFQWQILHSTSPFSSCPNSYIGRALDFGSGGPSSIPGGVMD